MFKKVLIAEDHESANISIQRTLDDLGITHDNKDHVFYCDIALTRIQKAMREGNPYELLITDLSFDEDAPGQQITSGIELIKAARQLQPDIKVLIFSGEGRASVAQSIMAELNVDAFVPKGRNDTKDLKIALDIIFNDRRYLSANLKKADRLENTYNFTDLEKAIVKLLAMGKLQKQIPECLEQLKITPCGLSTVEKKLNNMRTILNFSNNEQLIAYCKDKKVI